MRSFYQSSLKGLLGSSFEGIALRVYYVGSSAEPTAVIVQGRFVFSLPTASNEIVLPLMTGTSLSIPVEEWLLSTTLLSLLLILLVIVSHVLLVDLPGPWVCSSSSHGWRTHSSPKQIYFTGTFLRELLIHLHGLVVILASLHIAMVRRGSTYDSRLHVASCSLVHEGCGPTLRIHHILTTTNCSIATKLASSTSHMDSACTCDTTHAWLLRMWDIVLVH